MVESKAVHIAGDGLERERGEVEIATAPPWGSRYRGNPWNAEKQLRLRATERAREREEE